MARNEKFFFLFLIVFLIGCAEPIGKTANGGLKPLPPPRLPIDVFECGTEEPNNICSTNTDCPSNVRKFCRGNNAVALSCVCAEEKNHQRESKV